jgi:hypothetical protein
MDWLTGYSYRKKVPINPTASGTQTNYQMKLVVGESNTTSGTNTCCENHCQNFPNDIRFTSNNGVTKHDYWIETGSLTGTEPNRKITIWIKVTSIPYPDSIDLYMYYGKSSDCGESNGSNTHMFFDDFLNNGEGDWNKNIGSAAEHPIIKDNTLYFVGNGIWILSLNGTEQHHYHAGDLNYCAPVVLGEYVYVWEYGVGPGETCRLHKTRISDGDDTEVAGTRIDFECLTSTTVSGTDVIFIPKNEKVVAVKAGDLSTYWTSNVGVDGAIYHWDGGLILDDYLYTRQVETGNHKLFKLNLNNGTTASSIVLEDEPYYAPLLYDADHSQIILTEKNTNKIKAYNKDTLTQNWVYTLEETTGWHIMYGCSYHDDRLYLANKKDDKTGSYIYCINTTSGTKIWKSDVVVNVNCVITNHLLNNDYLFCPTHDYHDNNYHKMVVINILDGSIDNTINQSTNSSCCCPVISDGIIYLGMWDDHNINARKLGTGNKVDCPYKCDAAHTGYIGDRLTSYSPNPEYNLTDKWTNTGNYELFNNTLKKYASNTNTRYDLISKTTYSKPLAIEARIKVGDDWDNEYGWVFAVSWDSAWATLGYLSGHFKDSTNDYYRMFRWSSGLTDSDQTTESIAADTWYICSLLIGESNQYYKIDETQKATFATNPPTNSTNIILSTGRATASSSYTTYFDWIFARKYTSPEPTWGSWGDEEKATGVNLKFTTNHYFKNVKLPDPLVIDVLTTPHKIYFTIQPTVTGKIVYLI